VTWMSVELKIAVVAESMSASSAAASGAAVGADELVVHVTMLDVVIAPSVEAGAAAIMVEVSGEAPGMHVGVTSGSSQAPLSVVFVALENGGSMVDVVLLESGASSSICEKDCATGRGMTFSVEGTKTSVTSCGCCELLFGNDEVVLVGEGSFDGAVWFKEDMVGGDVIPGAPATFSAGPS